ncbi:uncharacterized protein FIBRA_06808 [Fibroporia radiculosa]|uniref:Uncharacterized protein n=1 Tax=Fibroporia radiculosa TaxID=599839 RepID=J4H499_9APHY|nr:uncharacterized protein FIBRA_06808 [Fibroporia radiculosa]CCM04624.1 predicted protein [Fibroporia radiculosa]
MPGYFAFRMMIESLLAMTGLRGRSDDVALLNGYGPGRTDSRLDMATQIGDLEAKLREKKHEVQEVKKKAEEELRETRREAQQLRSAAEDTSHKHETQINQWQKLSSKMKEQLHGVKKDNCQLKEQVNSMKGELHSAQQVSEERLRALTALEKVHASANALLEVRTSELQDAQKYLSKTDNLSDADVLRMFENLNSQIFQVAAQIADSVLYQDLARFPTSPSILSGVKDFTGPSMANILQTLSHSIDPFYVQLALQACMVTYTKMIIETWNFRHHDDNGLLAEIYLRMRKQESQTVSGRWRSLARHYLRKARVGDEELATFLLHYLLGHLLDILALSHVLGSTQELYDYISLRYGGPLRSVIEDSLKLHDAIGEEVVASNFEPLAVVCGSEFREECMKDEYSRIPNEIARREAVLCTTAVGLRRATKGSHGDDSIHETVLLKPVVVLESIRREV